MDSAAPGSLSEKAAKTAKRYLGAEAREYEQRRAGSAKWAGEDRKVREFLADLPAGRRLLDCPCGTGRFFPFYAERKFVALGVDVSPDMVMEADRRRAEGIETEVGSIYELRWTSSSFHVALCIRFLNLIQPTDFKLALSELQRVAIERVIFTLRVKHKNPTGHYHSPFPISLVEASLRPGWTIARNEAVHEEDYRLIELRHAVG